MADAKARSEARRKRILENADKRINRLYSRQRGGHESSNYDYLFVWIHVESSEILNAYKNSKALQSWSHDMIIGDIEVDRFGTLPLEQELLVKARISLSSKGKYIPYSNKKHRRSTSFVFHLNLKKICWNMNMTLLLRFCQSLTCPKCIQSSLVNPDTLIPSEIVRINEASGYLNHMQL
jgi:hypothetical protein